MKEVNKPVRISNPHCVRLCTASIKPENDNLSSSVENKRPPIPGAQNEITEKTNMLVKDDKL
jgi:hypothetical protein